MIVTWVKRRDDGVPGEGKRCEVILFREVVRCFGGSGCIEFCKASTSRRVDESDWSWFVDIDREIRKDENLKLM